MKGNLKLNRHCNI